MNFYFIKSINFEMNFKEKLGAKYNYNNCFLLFCKNLKISIS